MTPLLTIENLTMEFSGTRALDNISFTLDEGEILGVIGRSGAGKTVLIHLLRGIEQPRRARGIGNGLRGGARLDQQGEVCAIQLQNLVHLRQAQDDAV